MNKRSLLASAGTLAVSSLAGCGSFSEQPVPAGSLRFENNHTLPHSIRIEVTGVGAAPGDGAGAVTGEVTVRPAQRTIVASTTVDPGNSETYESVFTEPVWYGIQFVVDGEIPEDSRGTTAFNPATAGGGGWEILIGRVSASGQFSWVVSTTDNPGGFES